MQHISRDLASHNYMTAKQPTLVSNEHSYQVLGGGASQPLAISTQQLDRSNPVLRDLSKSKRTESMRRLHGSDNHAEP